MFKELFSSNKEDSILEKISEWSSSHNFFEVCGFVGLDKNNDYKAIFCENRAENPKNSFLIDPLEYLNFINEYEQVFIFHSHILGNEEPSEKDVMMSENSCFPFLIYSLNTKKFFVYEPKKSKTNALILNKFKSNI